MAATCHGVASSPLLTPGTIESLLWSRIQYLTVRLPLALPECFDDGPEVISMLGGKDFAVPADLANNGIFNHLSLRRVPRIILTPRRNDSFGEQQFSQFRSLVRD